MSLPCMLPTRGLSASQRRMPLRPSMVLSPTAPCCTPALLQTLGRLGVQWDRRTRAMRVPRDLYSNLLSVRVAGAAENAVHV